VSEEEKVIGILQYEPAAPRCESCKFSMWHKGKLLCVDPNEPRGILASVVRSEPMACGPTGQWYQPDTEMKPVAESMKVISIH
jgi:hypothetical protein